MALKFKLWKMCAILNLVSKLQIISVSKYFNAGIHVVEPETNFFVYLVFIKIVTMEAMGNCWKDKAGKIIVIFVSLNLWLLLHVFEANVDIFFIKNVLKNDIKLGGSLLESCLISVCVLCVKLGLLSMMIPNFLTMFGVIWIYSTKYKRCHFKDWNFKNVRRMRN